MYLGLSTGTEKLTNKKLESIYTTVQTENPDEMTSNIPRHILNLTREEKREFIDSFDTVLSDCDGVVWHLSGKIEDSGTGITLLQKAGKKVSFVTNNAVRDDSDYKKQFKNAEIEADVSDLLYPSKAVVRYLKKINFEGLIYCIAAKKFKETIREGGFEVIDGPEEIIPEDFTLLFRHVFEKQPVKAVIIDIDFNLSVTKLMKADQFLKQADCILIAGATDMILPVGKYGSIIGPGPYLKILEEASQKKAKILGKPGKELRDVIFDSLNIKDPKRVLFIGDMLEQDIAFGKLCGFQTLLVLTGGTSKEKLMQHTNLKEIPDFYADRLGDFIDFFNSLKCTL